MTIHCYQDPHTLLFYFTLLQVFHPVMKNLNPRVNIQRSSATALSMDPLSNHASSSPQYAHSAATDTAKLGGDAINVYHAEVVYDRPETLSTMFALFIEKLPNCKVPDNFTGCFLFPIWGHVRLVGSKERTTNTVTYEIRCLAVQGPGPMLKPLGRHRESHFKGEYWNALKENECNNLHYRSHGSFRSIF